MLNVGLDTVGLRLLLLNYSVNLILQALVLLEYLIVTFYLFLVRANILDNIDAAAVELRNVNVGLAAARTVHVLLRGCLLVDLLL